MVTLTREQIIRAYNNAAKKESKLNFFNAHLRHRDICAEEGAEVSLIIAAKAHEIKTFTELLYWNNQ